MKNKKLKHIFSEFVEKMSFKYSVSILNENTLEELWHTRLSRFSVFVYGLTMFLLVFILLTILIFLTPVKHYLPGFGDVGNRSIMMENSIVIDSISGELEHQQQYLNILKDIIAGNPTKDNIGANDTAGLSVRDTAYIEKSKKEKKFISEYEEDEKYNLSAINNREANKDNNYVLFKPVSGVIASNFDPQEGRYGITVITSPQENVMSVLEGTVVNTAFTFNDGWIMSIQHSNDYISIYKNNTKLLKRVGDYVKAGEAIAITGTNDKDKDGGKHFYFELWHKGEPVDPQKEITFGY